MPDITIIPTQTTLSVVGVSITITTIYNGGDLGGIISAWISEVIGGEIVDGISFIEGEGGIMTDDFVTTASLNSNGELIVTAPDAAQYSVDTVTGQLIYTY